MKLWLPKNRKQLKQHLNDPLFKNAYFLMLSSVTSAGSGFFFWLIAARFYSTNLFFGRKALPKELYSFLAQVLSLERKSINVCSCFWAWYILNLPNFSIYADPSSKKRSCQIFFISPLVTTSRGYLKEKKALYSVGREENKISQGESLK